MPMLSRRSFLFGAVALATTAGAASLYLPVERAQTTLSHFITRKLLDFEIPEADLQDFCADFLAKWPLPSWKQKLVIVFLENPALTVFAPPRVQAAQLRQERAILTRFLLATDAFDENRSGRKLSYAGFPDPYDLGCANRLATLG